MSEAKQSHDLSAESALLSQLFSRPDAVLPELRTRLQPRDFFSRQHGVLYQAVLELDLNAQPVDVEGVFAELAKRADHGLSDAELDQLRGFFSAPSRPATDPAGTSGLAFVPDLEALIQRVLSRSRSRELLRRMEALLESAKKQPEDLKRHLDEALASLLPVARELSREDADGLAAVAERLQRSRKRRSTGLKLLDSQERWFSDGELALLLGRTSHGKTNLMLNLAAHWLDEAAGAPLLYYSLEMTAEQLAGRLLAIKAARPGGTAPKLTRPPSRPEGLTNPLSPSGTSGRAHNEGWGERLQLRFTPRIDVDRLAADALRRMAGQKAGAVFVDSLTALMPPPQVRTHGRRDLELAEICRRLKELAVVLDCPVIAAVPARRDNLSEGAEPLRLLLAKGAEIQQPAVEDAIRWRRPRLEHLPEPGLEAHADVVLSLLNFVADYQEELDPEHRQVFKARPESAFEVSALKHRSGGLHGAELRMQMRTGYIFEP
jgi:replicative DNA helicase